MLGEDFAVQGIRVVGCFGCFGCRVEGGAAMVAGDAWLARRKSEWMVWDSRAGGAHGLGLSVDVSLGSVLVRRRV